MFTRGTLYIRSFVGYTQWFDTTTEGCLYTCYF